MKKIYLLQGIIFQKGHSVSLGFDSIIGTRATRTPSVHFTIFHGIVWQTEDDQEMFEGLMYNDRWGDSEITDFKYTSGKIKFKKRYKNGNRESIEYVFTKKEDCFWYGTYTSDDHGTDNVTLTITETTEEFFKSKD